MWGIDRLVPLQPWFIPYKPLLILITLISAIALGSSAVYHFHTAKTTVNPIQVHTSSSLVTHGVFRVSRNPMYLGLLLLLVAWGILLSNPLSWSIIVAFYYYMTDVQIKREERALEEIFGDAFIANRQQVRRWL